MRIALCYEPMAFSDWKLRSSGDKMQKAWISHVRFVCKISCILWSCMYARPIMPRWCLEFARPLASSRKRNFFEHLRPTRSKTQIWALELSTTRLQAERQNNLLQNLAIPMPQGKLTDGDVSEVLVVQQALWFAIGQISWPGG